MDLKPGTDSSFRIIGAKKNVDHTVIRFFKNRSLTVDVKSDMITVRNTSQKRVQIKNVEKQIKAISGLVIEKNRPACEKKCSWLIQGSKPGSAYNKEVKCEDEMTAWARIITADNNKRGHSSMSIGQVRLAQDIPGKGVNKRYWFAQCQTIHYRREPCDEGALMDIIMNENSNYYEVVRDEKRRHYFDVEWMTEASEKDNIEKLKLVLHLFRKFLIEFGIDNESRLFITKGSRLKPNGMYKHSYHVVYESVCFANKDDHAFYMMVFRKWLALPKNQADLAMIEEIADYKAMTRRIYGYAYDHAVYTKNRLMRLPGQTKPEPGCKPFAIVEELEGFDCMIDPIFITGRFAKDAVIVKISNNNETFQQVLSVSDILGEKQSIHFHTILKTQKEMEAASKERGFLFMMKKHKINKWYEMDAKQQRRYNYCWYLRYLAAVIDIFNPPKDLVLSWMMHRDDTVAETKYSQAEKYLTSREDNINLLQNVGLIDSLKELCDMAYEKYIYKPTTTLRMYKDLYEQFPVFKEVDDLSEIDLQNHNVADIVTGKMGSGKTLHMLKKIGEMPAGSRVLWLVGRIVLANEIRDKAAKECVNFTVTRQAMDEENVMCVGVINSLNKYLKGDSYNLIVIDEAVTTINNLEMDSVSAEDICDKLKKLMMSSETKTVVIDAMFTGPITVFFNSIFKLEVEEDDEEEMPLSMTQYAEKLNETVRDEFMDMLKKKYPDDWQKYINFEKVPIEKTPPPREYDYGDPIIKEFNTLSLKNSHVKPRVIRYMHNDKFSMKTYMKYSDMLEDDPITSSTGFGSNFDKGFMMKMMIDVYLFDRKIAVAVPSLLWINLLTKMFSDRKVLAIYGARNNISMTTVDMRNYDVLVYTSTVSAGHSIDIKDHFHCVYVVIANVDNTAHFKTPQFDEIVQMVARVRNPISEYIYYTVDKGRATMDKIRNNVGITLQHPGYTGMKRCKKDFAISLAHMNSFEISYMISKWLIELAFPGSKEEKYQIPYDELIPALIQCYHVFRRTKTDTGAMKLFEQLKNPMRFFSIAKRGNEEVLIFSPTTMAVFDEEERLTGLKLSKRSIGEGGFILTDIYEGRKRGSDL